MFQSSKILPGLLLWGVLCLVLPIGGEVRAQAASDADAVYVGQGVCRRCHDSDHRDQFNPWYRSAHARAYAALSMPESKEIARLSGIDVDPFKSPVCLGCHATASDAEPWQLDATFFTEDGIGCEHCHGPGSEYAEAGVMADRKAAMQAGLRMPGQDLCLDCHIPKGSHQAVLEVREFVYEEALEKIAHPGRGGALPAAAGGADAGYSESGFVGARVCGGCHRGEAAGFAYSKWRLSAHAEAHAVLGTDRARAVAKDAGLTADPRRASQCLRCHATGSAGSADPFAAPVAVELGVQCESCHGPGGAHAAAGGTVVLGAVERGTCEGCHSGYHGESFDYGGMPGSIAHAKPESGAAGAAGPRYKTPVDLALSRDGRLLFVACEASDSLAVVDTRSRTLVAEIPLQNQPNGVCLSPDEDRVFVSNRGSDSVSVVDARSWEVIATIAVGDEPHGLVTDAAGETLYVANAGSGDVSVVDLQSGREAKRLAAGRGTWGVSRVPGGASVFVTNNLSHFVEFRASSRSEVTVVGTEQARVSRRISIPDANLVQGIDFAPDGEFGLVTLLRTKNLVPITRVIQGGVITNGIGVLWRDGRVDQLLLDEPGHYFADPTDVVISPAGDFAYVSGGGIDAVAVIDLRRMKEVLGRATEEERREVLPNHLGVSSQFVLKRIGVGRSPRGLAASRDGRYVYVADALDDSVSVIDAKRNERIAVIGLGGPEQITQQRFGERVFHSAEVTFGQQFSCHSCHPDGGIDGITYDLEPDGLGLNPVDNRSLRGILDTAPFKWTGKNPTLSRQCGPRLAVFFTRIDPFTPEQVKALEHYICTIPRNPNRFRGEELSDAQRRGKKMFERTRTNDGAEIPEENRCDFCHSGPYYTNRKLANVGVISELDTKDTFDVPHLNNIYETAPYLHDGRSETLEEIWTRFNPDDTHGVTNDMTKNQLNDLIEYLKTL